jgi:hypothetical protein
MGQTREQLTPRVAERLWWPVARRDAMRGARRLSRQPLVDGGYRLDEGALLDEVFPCWQASGVRGLLEQVDGAAIEREMVPGVPYVRRDGVKTLVGLERMNALPAVLCRDEARRRLVGVNAHQVRDGVGPRGAAKGPHARAPTPRCPATLATQMVPCPVRALDAWCKGVMRAWATAGRCGKRGTGMVAGPDVETTARDADGGPATRQVRLADQQGQGHAMEVPVYGWTVLILLDAATTRPLAVPVGKIAAPATQGTRALVTHARAPLAGVAPRPTVVFAQGLVDGREGWWLAPQGIRGVVPATAHLAVTADARAPAAAGEGRPPGRRVHTVRQGPGQAARADRLEPEGVGITGLTTDDPEGTVAHGRHPHRRDVQPHLSHAVVSRTWQGKDDGPGGTPVCLTTASVQPPLRPCADDDDRRRIEPGGLQAATPPWHLGPPPPNNRTGGAGAGAVHAAHVCAGDRVAAAMCASRQGR